MKQCWSRSCHGRKNFQLNVTVSAANEQRRIIWQGAEDLTFTKKRRLPTDRRALILITSVIYRKRKIYVIFCRMERPCNPQLNYRAAIKIYPVFPGPNFRLSLHPLWSPSTKENLWTVYRQPPSIWESIGGNILFFFPKCPILRKPVMEIVYAFRGK